MKYAIGVDIGGTHVTAGIVDPEAGSLIPETLTRKHIDPDGTVDQVILRWAEIIREAADKLSISSYQIGMAMPGPFDYEHGISLIKGLHKYEHLYGLNVKDLLSAALGTVPGNIRLINDASAFLLGEKHCGAAKGYDNFVCITLGTGLGSAAWYNNQLEEGDLYSTAYLNAKAEDYLSSRWITGSYRALTAEQCKGAKEVAQRMATDPVARQIFVQFGQHLGNILVQRYGQQRPQAVIIGGNIAKAWDAFIPHALEIIRGSGYDFELKPAMLGEEAALIGAAYLFT